jgi:superfamily II DNA or RNA helicase
MKLRAYQTECLQAMVKLARQGVKRQLVAIPTGTGKTVIFSQLPPMAKGRRTLVIAHRKELIAQAVDKLQAANPELDIGVEMAERKSLPANQVVVGSVQTLTSSMRRLNSIEPDSFGLVVCDEAHHIIAKTYLRILHRMGLSPDPDQFNDYELSPQRLSAETKRIFREWELPATVPYLFGFTATPHRTDGRGLEAVFDEVAYTRTIREMIEEGWLVDVRAAKVPTGANLKGVKTRRGDFVPGELSEAVNTPERNETVVNSFLALASDRQAICFAADVQHTEDLTAAFSAAQVRVAMVTGETPKRERDGIISAYQRGETQVLVNCMVLTEGFDAPETSCIVMARPTKSSLMYTQMLGRGTRLAEGKRDLLVIDLVDIGAAGVSTVNTMFGLPPKLALTDEPAVEVLKELDELDGALDFTDCEALTVEDVRRMAMDADPLEAAKLPAWLHHTMAWVKTSYGYALDLLGGDALGIVVNHLGGAEIRLKERTSKPISLGYEADAQLAVRFGERWVLDARPDTGKMLNMKAPWRNDGSMATQKQLDYLRYLRVDAPPGLTKGQAATLITAAKSGRVSL